MTDLHLFAVLSESVLFRLSEKKLNVKPLLFEILLHYIWNRKCSTSWTSYTFSFSCAITKAKLSLMSNSHSIGLHLSVTAVLCNLELKKKDIVNNQQKINKLNKINKHAKLIKYRNIDSLHWLSYTPLNDSTSDNVLNFIIFFIS